MIKATLKTALNFVKNKQITVGIPVIIKNSKGEILLGKRSNKVIFYPLTWGLPGGLVDYKELLKNTAIREVKEEMGVDIKIIKSGKIHECFPTKECKLHAINIPYYAKIIKGIPKPKDETSEVNWFSSDKIKKMRLAYTHKAILKKEGLI